MLLNYYTGKIMLDNFNTRSLVFIFGLDLLGVMRTKNKTGEAFLYGLSTSRAADVNTSHLNYFWQVIEISLGFFIVQAFFVIIAFLIFFNLQEMHSSKLHSVVPTLLLFWVKISFWLLRPIVKLVFEDEFIHLMDYLRIVPCIYFQWFVSAARNNLTTWHTWIKGCLKVWRGLEWVCFCVYGLSHCLFIF